MRFARHAVPLLLSLHGNTDRLNSSSSSVAAFSAPPNLSFSRKLASSHGNHRAVDDDDDDGNRRAQGIDNDGFKDAEDDERKDGGGAPRHHRAMAVAAGILSAQQIHLPRALAEGSVGLAGIIAASLMAGEDVAGGASATDLPKEAIIQLTAMSAASPSASLVVVDSAAAAGAPQTKPASSITNLVDEATAALDGGATASATAATAAPVKDTVVTKVAETAPVAPASAVPPAVVSAAASPVAPSSPAAATSEPTSKAAVVDTISATTANIMGKEGKTIDVNLAKIKAAEAEEKVAARKAKIKATRQAAQEAKKAVMRVAKESAGGKGVTEWGKELLAANTDNDNLKLLAVPGLIVAGIAATASSFFGGEKKDDGEALLEGESKEYKFDTPVPYGLQQGTPKAGVGVEKKEESGAAPEYSFPSTDSAVKEKVPKEPVMKSQSVLGKSTAASVLEDEQKDTSLPDALKKAQEATSSFNRSSSESKPTGPIAAATSASKATASTKSISMANVMKGTDKVDTDKEWKFDKPVPYGLQKGTPKSAVKTFGSKKQKGAAVKSKFSPKGLKEKKGKTSLQSKSISMVKVLKGGDEVVSSKAAFVAKGDAKSKFSSKGAVAKKGKKSLESKSISMVKVLKGSDEVVSSKASVAKDQVVKSKFSPKGVEMKKGKKSLESKSISMVKVLKGSDDTVVPKVPVAKGTEGSISAVLPKSSPSPKKAPGNVVGDGIVETGATTPSIGSSGLGAAGLDGGSIAGGSMMMKGAAGNSSSVVPKKKSGGFGKGSWKAVGGSSKSKGKGLARKSISMVDVMKKGDAVVEAVKESSGEASTGKQQGVVSLGGGAGMMKGKSSAEAAAAPNSKGFGKASWKTQAKSGPGSNSAVPGSGSTISAAATVDTSKSQSPAAVITPPAPSKGSASMGAATLKGKASASPKSFAKSSPKKYVSDLKKASKGIASKQPVAAKVEESPSLVPPKAKGKGFSMGGNGGMLKGKAAATTTGATAVKKGFGKSSSSSGASPPGVGMMKQGSASSSSSSTPVTSSSPPAPGAFGSTMLKGKSSSTAARPKGFGAKTSPSFGKGTVEKGFGLSPPPGFGLGSMKKGGAGMMKQGGKKSVESKSISMVNVMKDGADGRSLEQASVPVNKGAAASSPVAASGPATPVFKSQTTPPIVPTPPAPRVPASTISRAVNNEMASQRQQPPRQYVAPQSIGQFGSDTARGSVRNGPVPPPPRTAAATTTTRSAPPATPLPVAAAANQNNNDVGVSGRETEPVTTMEGGTAEKKTPLSVTITDPRTGKKRTISVSN